MCFFHSGASANKDSNVKVRKNCVMFFSAVLNLLRWFSQCDWFIFEDIFLYLSFSLQFCGPQKMSRVCDLHLSWLCDGSQTRCEQIYQRIRYCAFSFTFLLLSCFPFWSRFTIIIIFIHPLIARNTCAWLIRQCIHPSHCTALSHLWRLHSCHVILQCLGDAGSWR